MNAALLRFAAAFLILLGSLALGQGDPAVIKIVSSLPRTGSARGQTDTIVNGITMALEEAGWKAGAFTIKYEDLDDATAAAGQWTAEKEAANADQAIKDADVMIYIGTYNSGAAKVSMPKLNQAGMLMVSPANSWPGLTKPGKGDQGEPEKYRPSGKINYVRVVPADDIQGVVSADWALKLGLKKVYILDDREVYGKGIADLFHARADELKEQGLTVLGHDGIDAQAQEFKPLMTKIKAKGPQLIYFGGTTQTKAGQLVKDMLGVGLDAKFMCPDGCYENAFIDSAGADNLAGRALITFGGLPPERLTGKGAAFVKNYQAKYKKMPEGYAVYGYECGKVALAAIARAGKKDRDAIRAAGLTIKNFDGALGKWSFDKNGDTTLRTMSGNGVKAGQFEFMTVLGEDN
ncbi:MAG: branched-chain amino acid ABC transporter substrate-binding protein [Planctomycetes bacterium]|nr:branched-chain amino acid ABC transporter substrate-binding protein [Planctomycetota bacterium]